MLKGLLILPVITTDLTLPFRALCHPAGLAVQARSVQALPLCNFPCPAGEAALTILPHTDGTNGGLPCLRQRGLAELAPFSGGEGDRVQPWWGLAQPGAHLEEVGLDGESTRVHGARLVYWSCEWAEHRRVAEGTGKARPSS